MAEQLELPLARRTDPQTSERGARDVRPRAGTQSWLILESYGLASEHGLTSDEAGTKANLLHTGYWKRCSDLYRAGFIMTVLDDEGRPVVRKGLSGSGQEVRKITSKGRSWLAVNA